MRHYIAVKELPGYLQHHIPDLIDIAFNHSDSKIDNITVEKELNIWTSTLTAIRLVHELNDKYKLAIIYDVRRERYFIKLYQNEYYVVNNNYAFCAVYKTFKILSNYHRNKVYEC